MIPAFSDPFRETVSKSGGGNPQSKKEVRTGQALNVVATVGGLNALRMAVPEAHEKYRAWKPRTKEGPSKAKFKYERAKARVSSTKPAKAVSKPLGVVLKPIKKHPAAATAALGVGLVGLHSAELTGDAIAARSMHHTYKELQRKEKERNKR